MNRIQKMMEQINISASSKEIENVLINMVSEGDRLGFFPAKHIARVASIKAKSENWTRCPCDAENTERFCISDLCQKSIQENGRCHCGCFTKVKEHDFMADSTVS